MAVHELLAAGVALIAILGGIDAFWTKKLPRLLRGLIGYYELKETVECIEEQTSDLRQDHEEVMGEIQTLKAGQVDIAETVTELDDNGLEVDKLRDRHFPGDADRPGDFTSGDD